MPSTEPTRGLASREDLFADTHRISRLSALSIEHDDLDAVINALLEKGACDDLLLTRLKKRKLHLIACAVASLSDGVPSMPVAQAS